MMGLNIEKLKYLRIGNWGILGLGSVNILELRK